MQSEHDTSLSESHHHVKYCDRNSIPSSDESVDVLEVDQKHYNKNRGENGNGEEKATEDAPIGIIPEMGKPSTTPLLISAKEFETESEVKSDQDNAVISEIASNLVTKILSQLLQSEMSVLSG